jgi:hypothetical protein
MLQMSLVEPIRRTGSHPGLYVLGQGRTAHGSHEAVEGCAHDDELDLFADREADRSRLRLDMQSVGNFLRHFTRAASRTIGLLCSAVFLARAFPAAALSTASRLVSSMRAFHQDVTHSTLLRIGWKI